MSNGGTNTGVTVIEEEEDDGVVENVDEILMKLAETDPEAAGLMSHPGSPLKTHGPAKPQTPSQAPSETPSLASSQTKSSSPHTKIAAEKPNSIPKQDEELNSQLSHDQKTQQLAEVETTSVSSVQNIQKVPTTTSTQKAPTTGPTAVPTAIYIPSTISSAIFIPDSLAGIVPGKVSSPPTTDTPVLRANDQANTITTAPSLPATNLSNSTNSTNPFDFSDGDASINLASPASENDSQSQSQKSSTDLAWQEDVYESSQRQSKSMLLDNGSDIASKGNIVPASAFFENDEANSTDNDLDAMLMQTVAQTDSTFVPSHEADFDIGLP